MEQNYADIIKLGTSALSDAMDRLGIPGQALGIKPVDRSFQLCGPAYTIHYIPVDIHGGSVGDFIDDVPPGQVVVIDNGGRTDCTVWGDILTVMGSLKGVGGTVINGVCRDSLRALEVNYPIFSRGTYMRTGKDRVMADAFNTKVSLGEISVTPGDILAGDFDGIVVIPQDRLDEVVAVAREIEDAEDAIRESIKKGMSLLEARTQFNYHQLQTRR
ncbi:MAG TPA: RraA family protein [Dehalococcoidia bacterium]|nr:RraA family protein [Dehalococcoidia bacterium]